MFLRPLKPLNAASPGSLPQQLLECVAQGHRIISTWENTWTITPLCAAPREVITCRTPPHSLEGRRVRCEDFTLSISIVTEKGPSTCSSSAPSWTSAYHTGTPPISYIMNSGMKGFEPHLTFTFSIFQNSKIKERASYLSKKIKLIFVKLLLLCVRYFHLNCLI